MARLHRSRTPYGARLLALWIGGSLTLAGAVAAAEEPFGPAHDTRPAARKVAFDEAIGLGQDSPELRGYDDALRMRREGAASIPRASQNPQLQVMPGARLPGADQPGFELQVTLTQGWRLGGYGNKRRAASRAETDVQAAELRARQLLHSLGAAGAWIDLHAAELRLAQAQAALENDRQLLATLEKALALGAATRLEVSEAQVAVGEARLAVTELQGEVHDLGLRLARETGVVGEGGVATRGDYPDPELPSHDRLREEFAELSALPVVDLERLEARAARARAVESEAQRSSLLSTGVSIQRESSADVVAFGVVGIQIPVVDRNQHHQLAERSEAVRAEARGAQRKLETEAQLRVALHDLHHTEERLRTLREESLPALDARIEALERALDLGETTRVSLLRARHLRHLMAQEEISAEARRVWARVEVWLYLQALRSGRDLAVPAGAANGGEGR